MAQRRMFSNRIANSAKFLQMPIESQLLYFHLILRADDDGIVESYPVIKILGITPDNFKILLAKNYIKQLNEDQVIVITDWLEHNIIRADRKVNSIYKDLLQKECPELPTLDPKPRSDVEDNSKRLGCGQSTDGIGKVRLGKVITLAADAAEENLPFDFEAYKEKMKSSKQRHIKIIGWYFDAKGLTFPSLKAIQTEIKRHLRDASVLADYPDKQTAKAVQYVKNKFSEDWKLSTVLKYINQF